MSIISQLGQVTGQYAFEKEAFLGSILKGGLKGGRMLQATRKGLLLGLDSIDAAKGVTRGVARMGSKPFIHASGIPHRNAVTQLRQFSDPVEEAAKRMSANLKKMQTSKSPRVQKKLQRQINNSAHWISEGTKNLQAARTKLNPVGLARKKLLSRLGLGATSAAGYGIYKHHNSKPAKPAKPTGVQRYLPPVLYENIQKMRKY